MRSPCGSSALAHDLGLQTVAVYSQADAEALHVLFADEADLHRGAPSSKSYLKIANILSACEITGADAIHPGYGFLSENANFASICESSGLNFIGPSRKRSALLGDKAKAKATGKAQNVPLFPVLRRSGRRHWKGYEEANRFGFPAFIKAVCRRRWAKGFASPRHETRSSNAFAAARAEAAASFGNPDVYLEKMIHKPAPHRGANLGRQTWQLRPPRRTRLHHPETPPKADRRDRQAPSLSRRYVKRSDHLQSSIAQSVRSTTLSGPSSFSSTKTKTTTSWKVNTRFRSSTP